MISCSKHSTIIVSGGGATQTKATKAKAWIAPSLRFLAMTVDRSIKTHPVMR
jgi:hypothetical protein